MVLMTTNAEQEKMSSPHECIYHYIQCVRSSALSVCKDIDSATIGTILKEPNRNSITMIVRPNFCPGALLSR